MTREKQEITTWKYPYTAIDTTKNMKEYGIGPALSHDWERTKEAMESRLEQAALGVVCGLAICVVIPVGIYLFSRLNKEQRKKRVADEGFYPEVYDNKNQIKRY